MVMNGNIEFREVERKLEETVEQFRVYLNGKWSEWKDTEGSVSVK